ncbi:MAG: hypothetical protein OQL09_08480 [Gammaproteobacteria bacterium]|nr:hypothetical protein [Gammaproteobacteria bacterium]
MAKSLKADHSTRSETAISRRNLHLSNLLSFGFRSYTRPIKKMTTENTDLELQLDAVLDDKGRVTEISIKH